MNILSFKVDVDTISGLRNGVPLLLDLFKEYNIKASFFVPMGPDRTGKKIKRILNTSYLIRILKMNPIKLVGLKNLLYGTLLPAPNIPESAPEVIKEIIEEGHELGIHGYDHTKWTLNLHVMKEREIDEELKKAYYKYKEITKSKPVSFAAPGWKTSKHSLEVLDKYGFIYSSDTRGISPFYPKVGNKIYKTLQVPTTLPTLDELAFRGFKSQEIIRYILHKIKRQKYSVFGMHAEQEGKVFIKLFRDILDRLIELDIRILPIVDIAISKRKNVRVSEIIKKNINGLDNISFQKVEI